MMRAWRWMPVVAAGLAVGCTPEAMLRPPLPATPPEKPAPRVAAPRPVSKPPVVAGEVSPTNVRERLQALDDEMAADLQALADARQQEAASKPDGK